MPQCNYRIALHVNLPVYHVAITNRNTGRCWSLSLSLKSDLMPVFQFPQLTRGVWGPPAPSQALTWTDARLNADVSFLGFSMETYVFVYGEGLLQYACCFCEREYWCVVN